MSTERDCQILISNDEIAFPVNLLRDVGSVIEQTEECLYTPYGAFFSINAESYNVIDFLETNGKHYCFDDLVKAVILDHEGRLYEVTVEKVDKKYRLTKNRLQYGNRLMYSISTHSSLEIEGNVALDLAEGNLQLATKIVTKGSVREIVLYDVKTFSFFMETLQKMENRKPICISEDKENKARPIF